MADRDDARFRLHKDAPLFREAITYTAAKTGFAGQVIEKDYFCTVLLGDFARHGGADLIFKGGTCLAKVHVGFYRLSEDLDFTIPMPVDASRSERSRAADAVKQAVADVSQRLPGFSCAAELKGANDSAQYSGVVAYRSVLSDEPQTILIDVSVREPALTPPVTLAAQTVLMDPISGQSAVPGLEVACINSLEAMAEKFRAAMSRRDVAIRDFYDLDSPELSFPPASRRARSAACGGPRFSSRGGGLRQPASLQITALPGENQPGLHGLPVDNQGKGSCRGRTLGHRRLLRHRSGSVSGTFVGYRPGQILEGWRFGNCRYFTRSRVMV